MLIRRSLSPLIAASAVLFALGTATPALAVDSKIYPPSGCTPLNGSYHGGSADILENGQREPIWIYDGKIIDGRNRYRACRDAGIEPALRTWNGEGSLVQFVVSLNLHRRHLTSSQRAAIAAEALEQLKAEAKERQREGGRKKVTQKIGGPGAATGTSKRTPP